MMLVACWLVVVMIGLDVVCSSGVWVYSGGCGLLAGCDVCLLGLIGLLACVVVSGLLAVDLIIVGWHVCAGFVWRFSFCFG